MIVYDYLSETKAFYGKEHILSDEARKAFGAKWRVPLSGKIALLAEGNGGGSDPSYEYYHWVLFSTKRFAAPLTDSHGNNEFISIPLEEGVEVVKSATQISPVTPREAYFNVWKVGKMELHGTLVRADEGDYLDIEQFKAANP